MDTSFDPGAGADGPVETLLLEPSGTILVGGDFTRFNGRPCLGLVRLAPYPIAPDLTIDTLVAEATPAGAIAAQFVLRNIGFIDASLGGMVVDAVLSANDVHGDADDLPLGRMELGTWPVDELEPGGVMWGTMQGGAASDLPTHPFLLVKVDVEEALAEIDEENNLARFRFDLQPAPPALLEAAWENDRFTVRVPTTPGYRYVLESKDRIDEESWTAVVEVQGDGQTLTIEDPNATAPQRFYRVRVP